MIVTLYYNSAHKGWATLIDVSSSDREIDTVVPLLATFQDPAIAKRKSYLEWIWESRAAAEKFFSFLLLTHPEVKLSVIVRDS